MNSVDPKLVNGARTAVQALWGIAVAHYAVLSNIPAPVAVEFIMTVVVIGWTTAAIRWLETRTGDAFWPKLARWSARVIMLGLSGVQPVYVAPGTNVRVIDGEVRPLL